MDTNNSEVPSNWKTAFIAIWVGQAFSVLGSSLVQFALVWWMTQSTGSATVLATATVFAVLPSIFLGPLVGPLVDRFNRRVVIMLSDGLIAGVTIGLIILFSTGQIQTWQIYAALFLRSLVGEFHWPSFRASTSLMVPKKELARIGGINQALHGTINIAAPPLGALLLGLLPIHWVLSVDVITAVLAITPLFFVKIPQPARLTTTSTLGVAGTFYKDFREGLRYVISWPGLLTIMIFSALINFFVNPGFVLLPLMVTKHWGGGVVELGWLESAIGVGIVMGGVALGIWGGFRRRIVTALAGLIGIGVGQLVMAAAPKDGLWLGLVGIFIIGVMNAFTNGPMMAIVQAHVKPEIQGRVMTLTGSSSTAMIPLSMLIAGPVADALGIPFWYALGGFSCVLMGIIGFFLPSVLHIEANHKHAINPDEVGETLPPAEIPAD